MEIAKLFGLPAHPLFVHVPVVLLPMVGLGVMAMAISGAVRERFGWLILALGIIAGLSTQLAIGSGKALRHSVPRTASLGRHVGMAESIRPLALLLFLVGLALMLADRRATGRWPYTSARIGSARRWVRPLLVTAAVVVAVGTNVRLFQIGDSGARATWDRVRLTDRNGG